MSEEEIPRTDGFRFKPTDFERLNPEVPAAAPVEPSQAGPGTGLPVKDVHDMLRQNAERDRRGGWYDVRPGRDLKLRRRWAGYGAALLVVDLPLGWIAWECGHTDPFPFVAALAGLAIFTGRLTWETWFLRTD